MVTKTFKELEKSGWQDKASAYDDNFALITQHAIDPLLDNFDNLVGKRLLDLACGTGHLAGESARRGAEAEGIDFANKMVEIATVNYPYIVFHEGDAENLFYEDESFDAVACNFGMLHFENAELAISEVYRVLHNGGQFAFTVWCSPDQGSDFMQLILGAVQKYGSLDVDLPPAPPMFRFSDSVECKNAVKSAGFSSPKTTRLELEWVASSPDQIIELIYKSIVRTPMILEAQTPEARERIHAAIIKGAEAFQTQGKVIMAFPAMMTTAKKLL